MIWMRKDEKMCKINICKLRNDPSYTLKRTDWTANIQNLLAKRINTGIMNACFDTFPQMQTGWTKYYDVIGMGTMLVSSWGQSVRHLHMWADSKTHFTVYDPNNNSSSLPCRVWITQSSSTWRPWQIVALFLNLVSCSTFYRDSVMEPNKWLILNSLYRQQHKLTPFCSWFQLYLHVAKLKAWYSN